MRSAPQPSIPLPLSLYLGLSLSLSPSLSIYIYIYILRMCHQSGGESLWGGDLKKSFFSNLAGVSIFDGRGRSKRGSRQTRFHFLGAGPVFTKNPLGWKISLSRGHQNQSFFMWAGVSIFDGRGSFPAGVQNFCFFFF